MSIFHRAGTTEAITFAMAHVWVTIPYFKTLSVIPSCGTVTGRLQTLTEWKKKSAKKPLYFNYLELIMGLIALSS